MLKKMKMLFGGCALAAALLLGGCEGSSSCGPEPTPATGCTLLQRGECPSMDRYLCGGQICRYDGTECYDADAGSVDAGP